jgi:hypothetical protein
VASSSDATRFKLVDGALDRLPPDQRRLAIRALGDMAGGQKANALWRFDPLDPNGSGVPHIPQHSWLSAWQTPEGRLTKFRLFAGGNRAGKTTAGDVGLIVDCCDRDAVPPHLHRYKRWDVPVQAYLVAVSGRAVEKIHVPIFRKWCPKDQLVGGSFEKAFNKEYQTLHFKNGSAISFMTQGMEVDVFQGTSLHVVQFDEEPLHDHGREIFGECIQRLVDFNGDMRFTFTPLNGLTWVYDTLWKPWEEQQPDREGATHGFAELEWDGHKLPIYCHRVDQDDNPVIDAEGKAAAMAMAASDEERRARKSGLFVSMAGRVFEAFSRSRHVVPDDMVLERIRKPGALQLLLGGLDPGFRHMAAALWVGLDEDGIWVGPEVICVKTIIPSVAAAIQDTAEGLKVPLPLFMADPAIVRMDGQTGISDQVAFMQAGITTRLANNSRRPGINAIRTLCDRDRIHIAASCDVLIDQLQRARWRTTGRSENDAPEDMVKKDDHAVDALRYAVMAMPIPEVQPVELERTKQQRQVAADIERAMLGREDRDLPFGGGFWE